MIPRCEWCGRPLKVAARRHLHGRRTWSTHLALPRRATPTQKAHTGGNRSTFPLGVRAVRRASDPLN